jgi:Flp pilus assembly protein CpaB
MRHPQNTANPARQQVAHVLHICLNMTTNQIAVANMDLQIEARLNNYNTNYPKWTKSMVREIAIMRQQRAELAAE